MNQHRGAFTAQIARKRKERDDSSSLFLPAKKDSNMNHVSSRGKSVQTPPHSFFPVANTTSSILLKKKPQQKQQEQAAEPVPASTNNQLLAGYMAYEFLTKGSLLGQSFDPARADQAGEPFYSLSGELEKKKLPPPPPPLKNWNGGGSGAGADERAAVEKRSYDEVATLLKTDGAHIPGIVNPTQLARWIQM